MQTKLTLGWLHARLDRVITHHRLEMTYGCQQKRLPGWAYKYTESPFEDNSDYWIEVMSKVHPWNKLLGVYMQFAALPLDTEVWLDAEVIGKILAVTGEHK